MDKTQRYLMMALPLFFVVFIIDFPVGLVIYWVTTNLWTVGQGLVTRRLIAEDAGAADAEALVAHAAEGRRRRAATARRRRDAAAEAGARRGPAAAPRAGAAQEEGRARR